MKMFLGNGEEVALLYPYYYSKLFYDGLAKEGEKEILSLARSAWLGSQKYGTLLWSGDIASTFESLRKQVKLGLNVSMCGIPWWTTDIGGFYGADITSDYFKELIVRWFQFGVFSPVTRLHGSRRRPEGHVNRHDEVLERSGGDNEIWSFGEEAYQVLKDLVELRERLRPYVQKHMDIASKTGTPVMRPMFYDYYQDETCYKLDDQYMFGDDILFAPIVIQGQVSRKVYLPAGITWVNINDKKEYVGGEYVACHAEINQFIAFVKKGKEVLTVF
jgi:alpha-D-xyloside xylohydrolase